MFSLPDNVGQRRWTPPLVVPPGTCLSANFINNDAEQQWMNAQMTGWLVQQQPGQSYHEAFAFMCSPMAAAA
jgi:hypothetical protein